MNLFKNLTSKVVAYACDECGVVFKLREHDRPEWARLCPTHAAAVRETFSARQAFLSACERNRTDLEPIVCEMDAKRAFNSASMYSNNQQQAYNNWAANPAVAAAAHADLYDKSLAAAVAGSL